MFFLLLAFLEPQYNMSIPASSERLSHREIRFEQCMPCAVGKLQVITGSHRSLANSHVSHSLNS